MSQTSTPTETESTFQIGTAIAIAFAVLATMLGVFAVGRSLSVEPRPSAGTEAAAGDAAAAPVEVTLSEFAIASSIDPVPAAPVTVTNEGSAAHNLAIRGTELTTSDLDSGATETLDLSSLAPGTYEWLCTIPGHEQAGMVGEVTIAADGAVAEADVAASTEEDAAADTGYMTREEAQAKMAAMMESVAAFPAETQGQGAQLMEPTEVLPDGTKVFELVVDEIDWEVEPGKVVKAMAYNQQIPGPTIEVDLGDRYVLRVVNELDNEEHTLHPHGINGHELKYDGVAPITQEPIQPGGGVYEYVFEANEPSLGMYHAHTHSLHQIPDGLVGAIIVGDYAEATGQEGVTQEHVMVLNDAGVIGFSLNGKSFPATAPYVAQQGERVMVHYMNEGVMSHPMHLHGQTGLIVAKDGFPLPQPYRADTINVAPGERYTVVYDADMPGTWVWHCHILSHVKKADGAMFGMLTAMIVEEAETGDTTGGDF